MALRSDAVNISSFGMVMVRSFSSSSVRSALDLRVLRFAQPLADFAVKKINRNEAIEGKDIKLSEEQKRALVLE